MDPEVVLYLCDRKACNPCPDTECLHTTDVKHAVNFKEFVSGVYVEQTKN